VEFESLSWDQYFYEDCERVARKAKDWSRKTGAIATRDQAVLMTGFCGFPRGVNDRIPERYERSVKNLYTIHAEANVVAMAAREGVSLKGATIYCNLFPCIHCANAMIQAGIIRIVCKALGPNPIRNEIYHFDLSREVLAEAGVEVCEVSDETGQFGS
jgi:dCMP deaminase